jgi:hypothetical protein
MSSICVAAPAWSACSDEEIGLHFWGPAAAPVAPAAAPAAAPDAEEKLCYICYEADLGGNPLLTDPVCACKGSIALHHTCFFELIRRSPKCSVCKHLYNYPDVTAVTWDPADPAFQVGPTKYIHYNTPNGVFHGHFNVDDENRSHGIAKLYKECPMTGRRTLYSIRSCKHGKYHGRTRQWTVMPNSPVQFPVADTTFVDNLMCGPIKFYMLKKPGQLLITATIHHSEVQDPSKFRLFHARYSGKLDAWGLVKENVIKIKQLDLKRPSTFDELLCMFIRTPEQLGTVLEDGEHFINYKPTRICIVHIKDGQLEGEPIRKQYRAATDEWTVVRRKVDGNAGAAAAAASNE